MKYIFFLLTLFLFPSVAHASITITAVEYGNPTANDELIAITNSGSTPIDISSWSIQAKNTTSNTIQKKNFVSGSVIDAGATHIIAHKDGRYAPQAFMTYSSLSLASGGGTVALVKSTSYITSFDDSTVVDSWNYGVSSSSPSPTIVPTPPTTSSTPQTKSVSAVPEYIGIIEPVPEKSPVIINELFPKGDEFIELYNNSPEAINVSGLWLTDASGSTYALGTRGENTLIGAYDYYLAKRTTTRIALNDTDGETIILRTQSGYSIDRVTYQDDVVNNASFVRIGNSWVWSHTATPAQKNTVIPLQKPPIARAVIPAQTLSVGEVISVSGEDSTDPNDTIMSYLWNFGDGTEYTTVTTTHSYMSTGTYTISLTVADGVGATSTVSRTISVIDRDRIKVSMAGFSDTPPELVTTKLAATTKPVIQNPEHTGVVTVPPGVLGKRKFIVDGRTVEVTSDRKELPKLHRGTRITFRAQEIVRSERLVLQITVKDPIRIENATTAPPYEELTGEIIKTATTGFILSTTSTDYSVISGTRYPNDTRIKLGDIVSIQGVLLTDDATMKHFVVPYPNQLSYVGTTTKKTSTTEQLVVLGISIVVLIGLQFLLSIILPKIKSFIHARRQKAKNTP